MMDIAGPISYAHECLKMKKCLTHLATCKTFIVINKGPRFLKVRQLLLETGTSVTPWKTKMEPTNQPSRKENHLPDLDDYVPC